MAISRRVRFVLPMLAASFLGLGADDCESLKAPRFVANGDGRYTEPAAVVQALASALEAKDYADYAALLHESFEFHPRAEDVDDLPWMTGDSWDRAEELGMIAHMFDPNFSGSVPPVDDIEASMSIQSQETHTDGSSEAVVIFSGSVLESPTDGWTFDTRIDLELVPVDGSLKIREMKEIARLGPASSVEDTSFGTIKALYR